MRSPALSRQSVSTDSADDEENGGEKKGSKLRAEVVDSDKDQKDVIEDHIKSRRVMDEQRAQI